MPDAPAFEPHAIAEIPEPGQRPEIGVVHLGLGAFFRAHGAIYLDEAMAASGGGWGIVGTSGSASSRDGRLSTSGMRAKIDPAEEWRQIFREAWRFQRDFFYVENVHGADWDAVYAMYEPWLDDVAHRSDLTYLLDILGGETSIALPLSSTDPLCSVVNPMIVFSSVVLPTPLRPNTASVVPAGASSDTSSSTTVSP